MHPSTNPASPIISLAELNSLPSIHDKLDYIVLHAQRLQSKLDKERARIQLTLTRSQKVLHRLQPQPLHVKSDRTATPKEREKLSTTIQGLEEELRQIRKEDALIDRYVEEMKGGLKRNEHYTEWVVMPDMVWHLLRLS